MKIEVKLPGLFEAANAVVRARKSKGGPAFQRLPADKLPPELARLRKDEVLAGELVDVLYGPQIPPDDNFYKVLVMMGDKRN
jgi:hypothetical protein